VAPPAGIDEARRIVASVEKDGANRDEAALKLQTMGDPAVVALIEGKAKPFSMETRKWAIATLEAMNKKVPGEAVQAKDSALLAEVLLAYGRTHDLDAVGAVFAFVNAAQTVVREASREAIRHYGNDALPKLRETYTNLQNAPPAEAWSAADLARELFTLLDHARLHDLYALFDDALARGAAKGNAPDTTEQLEPAVQELNQVFARAPEMERRGEAVPIYVRYARTLEDRDPARALEAYRRAERLAPDGDEKKHIEGAIAWLDARNLAARGLSSHGAFQRALDLDPDNAKAKADLARLDEEASSRSHRLTWIIAALAALVAMLAAGLLFLRPAGGSNRQDAKDAKVN
jgi:hypothetical protein